MIDKIYTLMAMPSVIIEGSTYYKLDKKDPNVICHDGINRFFKDHDENAENPLVLEDEYPPIEGEENYIDRLVGILGPILYADDRTRPIHILRPVMSQLYRHPVYQAFIEENNPQEEQPNNINKEP